MSLIEREYSKPDGVQDRDPLAAIAQDMLVTMQAAWIEWQNGRGAEAAMQWIENHLCGPGLIPDKTDPYFDDAQAFQGLNRSEPAPPCSHCGKPATRWNKDAATCPECQERQRLGLLKAPDGPSD